MQRVTANINTVRVHWLVEELQETGITEIMVTEFFRPNCQISKIEFFCDDNQINKIRDIIHSKGSNGKGADHTIEFTDAGNNVKSIFPFL